MKTRNLLSALTVTAGLFAGSAHATITYGIDRTIGNGSVVGTITTDGALGNLLTMKCLPGLHEDATCSSKSNIINWDLLLDDGTGSFKINSGNSVHQTWGESGVYGSSNFWATSSSLLYDFTASGYALFQYGGELNIGSGSPYWLLGESSSAEDESFETVYAGPYLNPDSARTQYQEWSSEVIIGSVVASVPEPGSLVLLALGLTGIGCARKTKQG